MSSLEEEIDQKIEEKELKAVKGHERKAKLKKAELLGIKFITSEKGADLLNELSKVFDLVDVKQKDSKSEPIINVDKIIDQAIAMENLTFLDGVLVTWEIFNKILDKRLRDDNGELEGIIYKGRKYDYLGIIDDDVNDLLLNKVLEHGYFKDRGEYLSNQFDANMG